MHPTIRFDPTSFGIRISVRGHLKPISCVLFDMQELALLCINSIRKDLQDPNQRTRANALRTITGIRVRFAFRGSFSACIALPSFSPCLLSFLYFLQVPMVVHLVVMALKSAVKDGSAFVRKTAAHALPKVLKCVHDRVLVFLHLGLVCSPAHLLPVLCVRTDSEQEGALVEMVSVLLGDREPMVLASACFAFNEVCPDRFDLIHQQYRKLCHLLADLDEWGQTQALALLTRYARANFISPFTVRDRIPVHVPASSWFPMSY
jgi:AP-3 complex subunit beta